MTFYEWIRLCLMNDAKKHPIPKICRRNLRKAIRTIRRDQRRDQKNRARILKQHEKTSILK